MGRGTIFVLLAGLLLLAGCGGDSSTAAPPRLTDPAEVPVQTSRVVVPVSAELAELERLINAEVPKTLYAIDRQEKVCVPAARVTVCLKHERPCKGDACKAVPCKVGFQKGKVTPDLGCRVVGAVTRGPIRLTGSGKDIRLSMPVSASVTAKDVGKVISETATAEAETRAVIRLGMSPDWKPTAKVDIDYSWTEKPGIELLGQRFTFAGKADPELAKIIAKLEAKVPELLARLHTRDKLESAWGKAFTSVELNHRNPEVWLRLTPQQLGTGGYRVADGLLVLTLELQAKAETFVGPRPEDPVATPLPPATRIDGARGFRISAPVIADYAELEPVLEKALVKLGAKPIEVPAVGAVEVGFGRPTIYATQGGKLALGLELTASDAGGRFPTKGTVWLTGVPWNEPGSPVVRVRDLSVAGETDRIAGNLLLAVATSPAVIAEIEGALSQDFSGDLAKLKVKIDKALTDKRLGDFVLNARFTGIDYGVVQPIGQGVYLPVRITGTGDIRLEPLSAAEKAERAEARQARLARRAREDAAYAAAAAAEPAGPAPGPAAR
jgi:hypothetical protein